LQDKILMINLVRTQQSVWIYFWGVFCYFNCPTWI